MNKLQTFNHPMFGELPVVMIDGKEHFGATDVAVTLEYKQPHTAVTNHCDEDGVITYNVIDRLGRNQEKKFITLGNISRLIVVASKQSKNPEIKKKAKQYEKWIFDEIIPSIHKHGAFMTPDVLEQAIENPDFMIGLFEQIKKERSEKERIQVENKKLNTEKLVLEQQVNELKPKATYYDLILQNKSLISISQIAKDYGMGAPTMNKLLRRLGVQYKQGEVWLLYAKYQDKGFTQTYMHAIDAEKSKPHTKWTQKGRLFIYELLKNEGIVPMIEQELEGA